MIKRPHYVEAKRYEDKLKRVMKRLDVYEFTFDYDIKTAWIEFVYKKEKYRFEHSVQNARIRDIELEDGDAVFSQLVLALEDLSRLVERGIYDLQSWIAGMKMLPAPK